MKLKPVLAMLILPLAISSAYAEDFISMPAFTFSGFGTVALTKSNSDDAEFIRPNQLRGVKTDAKNSVDSNFGFQATGKFNEWLSVTGQGLVRKNVTDDYSAELTWAFAKAKVSDNLTIRAGRIGLPVYMISDYRNVGYANTFIRPPVEMYTQVLLETVDGVDAIGQTSFGDTTFTGQLAVGKSEFDSAAGFTAKFKNLVSINLVAEHGPFTFRFGRLDTKVTVDNSVGLNTVVGGLSKYGYLDAANSVKVNDTKASFTSFGLGLDWKNFVVQSEYGKRKSESLAIQDTTSWYTMFGYRFGKLLPYVTHASATQNSPRTVAGVPTSGPLLALGAGANAYASAAPLQTSNSVGLRWDFYKSAALKVQYDRYTPTSRSGTFVNAKPGFTGPVNVIAAGIDFVF